MTDTASGALDVELEFFLPPEELRPFVTTVYRFDVVEQEPGSAAKPIRDWLHPEWFNLRIVLEGELSASIGPGAPETVPRLVGRSAADYADRMCDVEADPDMQQLTPLIEISRSNSTLAQKDAIFALLAKVLDKPGKREAHIVEAQRALLDPACATVAHLAEQLAMTTRTLERFALDAFGFTPQLLIRRQRFLRSLAQFMLDPSMSWIAALDPQYYDQAQFTRDFKRFMGMGPRDYARLPHPVLGAAAKARQAVAGEAVQVLHRPARPAG
ncbi:helix-turn-helix domain-containing protein [Qipengyuania sp. GH38]|uniref:helix-turn-helix domain-containing protein n=1 Tax=Qipengyuania intermedia TaxID=2867244 RepID=UPI001C86B493|nr:helix-turn-helix domain-containing protein [Qipengyuania intermedia]MBX7513821.1 helix-turn-helix domain-containing protein [Qipengyuania intermedia]